MKQRAVRLPPFVVDALGNREWGTPTGAFVGKCWHTASAGTLTCTVQAKGKTGFVVYETRRLIVVEDPAKAWVPAHWRNAAARYCRQWPGSAGVTAWFAALSERERQDRCRVIMQKAIQELDKGEPVFWALAGTPEALTAWSASEAPWSTGKGTT